MMVGAFIVVVVAIVAVTALALALILIIFTRGLGAAEEELAEPVSLSPASGLNGIGDGTGEKTYRVLAGHVPAMGEVVGVITNPAKTLQPAKVVGVDIRRRVATMRLVDNPRVVVWRRFDNLLPDPRQEIRMIRVAIP